MSTPEQKNDELAWLEEHLLNDHGIIYEAPLFDVVTGTMMSETNSAHAIHVLDGHAGSLGNTGGVDNHAHRNRSTSVPEMSEARASSYASRTDRFLRKGI